MQSTAHRADATTGGYDGASQSEVKMTSGIGVCTCVAAFSTRRAFPPTDLRELLLTGTVWLVPCEKLASSEAAALRACIALPAFKVAWEWYILVNLLHAESQLVHMCWSSEQLQAICW